MSYSSPHHVRDFLFASCLQIVHDYQIRCQRRTEKDKKAILAGVREIDLCARLSSFFGPVANLAAQGTDDVDLIVKGPTIRAEVKYLAPPAISWLGVNNSGVIADWNWLLNCANVGDEFKKRAWIVFWPSISLYKFTHCLSVTRSHGAQFANCDFAPFTPYVEPEMPPHGANQRLKFKIPNTLSILALPGGKRVRVDIVGGVHAPIWAAIYTRTLPNVSAEETACNPIQIANVALQI